LSLAGGEIAIVLIGTGGWDLLMVCVILGWIMSFFICTFALAFLMNISSGAGSDEFIDFTLLAKLCLP
jgi:hypothetical protein